MARNLDFAQWLVLHAALCQETPRRSWIGRLWRWVRRG